MNAILLGFGHRRLTVRFFVYGRRLLGLIALACALAAFAPRPVLAQSAPAAAGVSAKDLDRVIATLEDDKARARLIADLKTLRQAQPAASPKADQGVLEMLSEEIGAFGDNALETLTAVERIPELTRALALRLADAPTRAAWGRILAALVGALAVTLLLDRVVRLGLARMRPLASPPEGAPLAARMGSAGLRALLDLIPVGVAAAAGWASALPLAPTANVRLAALILVAAVSAIRAILAVAEVLAAPAAPGRRLLPVDDETAAYLLIWTARLVWVAVAGRFGLEAIGLLGVPAPVHDGLVKGLGLILALMAIIVILQNRYPVAQAIRRAAARANGRFQSYARRLADLWHFLATLYIGAIYAVWAIPVAGGAKFMLRATVATIVILVLARTVSSLLRRSINRAFALSQEVKTRFPMLEPRANRYLPVLHATLRALVAIVTVLALLQAWGLETMNWIVSDIGRRLLASLISIGAVIVGTVLVWELVNGTIERYMAQTAADGRQIALSARARTLLPLARSVLLIVIMVMATLIVLSELGVNIAPLLAGAGIIGVAIGFGSQKLVQDVITGAFILFEDTIAVGDVVNLGSHGGVVEALSIRAIRLRDIQGSLHTVPFSAVGTVINMSRDFAYALFDIGIAYGADADRVMGVIEDLGRDMAEDSEFGSHILAPLEMMGLDRFDASSVVIRARFKTVAMKQWAVGREFNRRLKRRFDDLGIEIPFPQMTVWMANPAPAPVAAEPAPGVPPSPRAG